VDKNKQRIQQRFNAASNSYEKVAVVQRNSACFLTEMLVRNISDFYPSTILDLGTGTGFIPELLMRIYKNSFYTLNDISPRMLDMASQKFNWSSQVSFLPGDMETIDLENYDLVVSNLALQWVDRLETMLERLYLHSNIFAFSCLLDGTFKEWENLLRIAQVPPLRKNYPLPSAIESFIRSLNPHDCFFGTQKYFISFQNPRAFMQYLKNLGASAGANNVSASCLKDLVHLNHKIETSYVVFFGIVKRVS
jgi:malonyl-CoA O-methyltransferase